MVARRHQVALVLTAVLAAAAACQADARRPPQRPGPPAASAATTGFTLVASGDILPYDSVVDRAQFDAGGTGYDFRPMLEDVKPVISRADLALCHLDTVAGTSGALADAGGAVAGTSPAQPGAAPPGTGASVPDASGAVPGAGAVAPGAGGAVPGVSDAVPGAGGPNPGHPAFRSPSEIAPALAATGYDGCSTASHHSLDDGAAGVQRTLDALDGAGVRHAGTARTEAEADAVDLLHAGPARVAHLAYTYDTNGSPLPPGQPWTVNLVDERRILADARAARKAGADVVVVSLHWGSEWQEAPDDRQLALARTLTASRTNGRPDVDLILGTHTHVPQAYEKVNGTWVVYGLGDQIAGEMFNQQGVQDPRGNESTVARFTFAPPARPGGRWEVRKAEFVPQMYDVDAGRVVNLNQALARGAGVQGVRDRIRDVVLGRGAAKDGLVMGE
ncbi:CapA family protein [Streptomyces sp. NPDC049687]|uniref:CapA family protein n=1 Tax=Streptomyces sp. NPDC049687 TaxID=3365596 RepID=UPI0037B2E50C